MSDGQFKTQNIATFHDAQQNEVGQCVVLMDGRWQRIPPDILRHMVTDAADAREQIGRIELGLIIGLFRTVGGTVEIWHGSPVDAWAKADEPPPDALDALQSRVEVACDAYVLKADGTIER